MRELKFRVWDKLEERFATCDEGYQGHYVLSLKGEFHNLQNGSGGKEYIVQQYTGMKDRQGKDVYEGDIVKWGMSHDQETAFCRLRVVEFHEQQLIYKVVEVGEYPAGVDYLYEAMQPATRWCEVVGNVFENPELLTK